MTYRIDVPRAVFAALAYADVFGFPLTEREITRWLPTIRAEGATVRRAIRRLVAKDSIGVSVPFYHLPGRSRLVAKRSAAVGCAAGKWERARFAARLLSRIPTVRLVGVTGGLAVDNAGPEDDIDLLIVTGEGAVWTTRLIATALMDGLRMRRRPDGSVVADTVCLNMYLSVSSLAVPKDERDFYTAHEVLQMVPLFDRGGVYGAFLAANRWTGAYLPAAFASAQRRVRELPASASGLPDGAKRVSRVIRWVDGLAMHMQLLYMRRRMTREVVSSDIIRFHPKDARPVAARGFAIRIRTADIPLTMFFPPHKIAVTS